MPIVAEGEEEPNDTYVEQLTASAKAAIDVRLLWSIMHHTFSALYWLCSRSCNTVALSGPCPVLAVPSCAPASDAPDPPLLVVQGQHTCSSCMFLLTAAVCACPKSCCRADEPRAHLHACHVVLGCKNCIIQGLPTAKRLLVKQLRKPRTQMSPTSVSASS